MYVWHSDSDSGSGPMDRWMDSEARQWDRQRQTTRERERDSKQTN